MHTPPFSEAKVAFVVLAWNSERYIAKCIESVLSLCCKRLELWVVDNGSTDKTPDILAGIEKSDSRLRIISEARNLGTTVSRNKALKCISTDIDYICILDSDTLVNQEAFERMGRVLAGDQSIGVIGPSMMNSSGELQLSGRSLPTLGIKAGKACPFARISQWAHEAEQPQALIEGGLQDVGYLLSACWLMPQSAIQKVGMFDEKIFYAPEDVDWCLRCHKLGLRVVRCYNAVILHEYQRLSHKRFFSKINVEHIKGLAYYFKKHHYLIKAPSID